MYLMSLSGLNTECYLTLFSYPNIIYAINLELSEMNYLQILKNSEILIYKSVSGLIITNPNTVSIFHFSPLDNDTRTLIKWQNILAGSGFPKKVSELLIKTLLIVKFPKDNELCTGTVGKMRRRRAVSSSDPALSQQVADATMTDSL